MDTSAWSLKQMIKMPFNIDNVCVACLAVDRNLYGIPSMKLELFMLIIGEKPSPFKPMPAYKLCWECIALLQKTCYFRAKARWSLDTLKKYLSKSMSPGSVLFPCLSRLSKRVLPIIHTDAEKMVIGHSNSEKEDALEKDIEPVRSELHHESSSGATAVLHQQAEQAETGPNKDFHSTYLKFCLTMSKKTAPSLANTPFAPITSPLNRLPLEPMPTLLNMITGNPEALETISRNGHSSLEAENHLLNLYDSSPMVTESTEVFKTSPHYRDSPPNVTFSHQHRDSSPDDCPLNLYDSSPMVTVYPEVFKSSPQHRDSSPEADQLNVDVVKMEEFESVMLDDQIEYNPVHSPSFMPKDECLSNPGSSGRNAARTMVTLDSLYLESEVAHYGEYKPKCSSSTVHTMSESAMRSMRRTDASRDLFAKRPWKCESCIKAFVHVDDLKKHNARWHREEIGAFLCEVCKCRFNDAPALERHLVGHYRLYRCRGCDFSHRVLTTMNRHYEANHVERVHGCTRCSERLPTLKSLQVHIERHHATEFRCVCDEVFHDRNEYNAHKREKHAKKMSTECPVCKKVISNKFFLVNHLKTHERESSTLYCKVCDTFYKSQTSFYWHLKYNLKHADRSGFKYECHDCGQRRGTLRQLEHHIRGAHLKKPEFRCDVCSKTYMRANTLKRHTLTVHDSSYVPVKDKVCDICGKAFSTKRLVADHMVTHTKIRPYHCQRCPATFGQSGALYTHGKLVHEKVKRKWQKKKKERRKEEPLP